MSPSSDSIWLILIGTVVFVIGATGGLQGQIGVKVESKIIKFFIAMVGIVLIAIGGIILYQDRMKKLELTPVPTLTAISTFAAEPILDNTVTSTSTRTIANTLPTTTANVSVQRSTDAPLITDTAILVPATSTSTPKATYTPLPTVTDTTVLSPTNTSKPISPTILFTPVPATTVPTVQVIVDARGGWQNTNVEISTNDVLTIQYVGGDWTGNANNPGKSRGENAPWAERTEECLPVKGQDSSLVSRIGGGKSFVVGQYFSDRILSSGKLELRMNDCDQWLGDNDGAITVSILVNR